MVVSCRGVHTGWAREKGSGSLSLHGEGVHTGRARDIGNGSLSLGPVICIRIWWCRYHTVVNECTSLHGRSSFMQSYPGSYVDY